MSDSVASYIHSELRISVLNQHGEVGRRRPSLDRGGESGCHKRQQLALDGEGRHKLVIGEAEGAAHGIVGGE